MTADALLGPAEIREIAGRLGFRPAKRLGQNFVVDPGTVRRIVALAGVGPDDVVLEVGPGFGSLTLGLIGAARRVIAVEVDPVLAAELPHTVAARAPRLASRLTVVTADAVRVTAADLPGMPGGPPSVLAANLPYNVAVPVVLHLLATVPSLARGLVMVQAEVADRMTAAPGSRI
ncbi:MAG TPA: rRNA adenine dimethyltransferase family protein, partial [Streptosporangiaceae bacterium]